MSTPFLKPNYFFSLLTKSYKNFTNLIHWKNNQYQIPTCNATYLYSHMWYGIKEQSVYYLKNILDIITIKYIYFTHIW